MLSSLLLIPFLLVPAKNLQAYESPHATTNPQAIKEKAPKSQRMTVIGDESEGPLHARTAQIGQPGANEIWKFGDSESPAARRVHVVPSG